MPTAFVGPVAIWGKTYAVPGDNDDLNSVSGMTQLFGLIKADSVKITFGEEVKEVRGEGFLNAIGEFRTSRSIKIAATIIPQSEAEMAVLFGLASGDLTTESGDTPKRYRVRQTVNDPLNYRNLVIRQRDPETPTIYKGIYIIKGRIQVSGEMNLGQGEEAGVPIEIVGIAPQTGTYADVAWEDYQEYELTTPVITTILPASKSVGDAVVITGTGFGASQGAGNVTFNSGVDALTYYAWTDNSISVLIPATATTGNVTVTAASGSVSAGVSYTIV